MKPNAQNFLERASGLYACPTGEHENRHEGRGEFLWCIAFSVAPRINFRLAAPLPQVRDLYAEVTAVAGGDATAAGTGLAEALPEILASRNGTHGDIEIVSRGRARRDLSPDGYVIVARYFLECDGRPVSYAVQSLGRFDACTTEYLFTCSDRQELDEAVCSTLAKFRDQALKGAYNLVAQRVVDGALPL